MKLMIKQLKFPVFCVVIFAAVNTMAFHGYDDFSGTMDGWHEQQTDTGVTFEPDGEGRLQFYTTDLPDDIVEGRWGWNIQGSSTRPWTVQLDLGTTLNKQSIQENQFAWMIMSIQPLFISPHDYFYELGFEVGSHPLADGFFTAVIAGGDANEENEDWTFEIINQNEVSLILTFDPGINNLNSFYSFDHGQSMTHFDTYNLDEWGMDNEDTFYLMLKGGAEVIQLNQGDLFVDHILAIPEPSSLVLLGLAVILILPGVSRHGKRTYG